MRRTRREPWGAASPASSEAATSSAAEPVLVVAVSRAACSPSICTLSRCPHRAQHRQVRSLADDTVRYPGGSRRPVCFLVGTISTAAMTGTELGEAPSLTHDPSGEQGRQRAIRYWRAVVFASSGDGLTRRRRVRRRPHGARHGGGDRRDAAGVREHPSGAPCKQLSHSAATRPRLARDSSLDRRLLRGRRRRRRGSGRRPERPAAPRRGCLRSAGLAGVRAGGVAGWFIRWTPCRRSAGGREHRLSVRETRRSDRCGDGRVPVLESGTSASDGAERDPARAGERRPRGGASVRRRGKRCDRLHRRCRSPPPLRLSNGDALGRGRGRRTR